MTLALRFLLLPGVLLLVGRGSSSQTTASEESAAAVEKLAFTLDRGGSPPTHYTLLVDSTGVGTFSDAVAPAAPARSLAIRPETLRKLLGAIPVVEGGRCETHLKGIAKTGIKVLHYTGNGRDLQCTFNYSDQDRLNDAAATFEAVAQTVLIGDRLRAKLRFDRLGLDSELEQLESAVAAHNALEVQNIAPVLEAIVNDERVIEHARRRAEHLLADAGGGPASASTLSPK